MFLMIGISQGRKDLDHEQLVICTQCGKYGRYQVFMTFTQLLLFLIPCFRWGKKYYVQMSCCGTVYELNRTSVRGLPEVKRSRSVMRICGLPAGAEVPAWCGAVRPAVTRQKRILISAQNAENLCPD